MKVEYINFNRLNSITSEQFEEIAFIEIEEEKPAVILTLDDGQKMLISTSDWASISFYKG